VRSGAIQWQAESEHPMLNTSVTHITELEDAIREAVDWLKGPRLGWSDPVAVADQLIQAAASFGLKSLETDEITHDLEQLDDPFGTGDI